MSRYNQFAGSSSKLNLTGTDTPEGQAVYDAANPIILSWVAQCRLAQQQSGLGFFQKHLNTKILKATWMWNNGSEVLDVEVFSNPEVRELAKPLLEQPKEPEVIENKFEPEYDIPIPPEVLVEIEEIQIENGLPPIPPELIKCFVVLYNDTDCVVYDMRSFEKGLGTQKPLIKNFTTQGDWALVPNVTVQRLRNYFGSAINGGTSQNYWDYVLPWTLQMTNSLEMGPCAVASVNFANGKFSGGGYSVYRLKSGFKANATLDGDDQIGQVGLGCGFPALNATDNMIFANTSTFTVSEDGQLSMSGSDVYGHDSDLASTYSVPSTPLIPRFIDENGEAYFDLAYNFANHVPSMGERWLTGLFDAIPNDFKRALSVGGGSGSSTAAYPVLTQENGVDILRAKILEIGFEVRASEFGSGTWYMYSGFPESSGIAPWVITVPYPGSESDYTIAFYNGGYKLESSIFTEANEDGWTARSGGTGPEGEHMFTGFMQVSNGTYNLQGFATHATSYDEGDRVWPIDAHHFYLDGTNFTSTMESITGAAAENIQYAFMDVPLYSVQTIKRAET